MQKAHHDLRIKTKTVVSDGRRLQVQEKEQRRAKASLGYVEKDKGKFMEKNK